MYLVTRHITSLQPVFYTSCYSAHFLYISNKQQYHPYTNKCRESCHNCLCILYIVRTVFPPTPQYVVICPLSNSQSFLMQQALSQRVIMAINTNPIKISDAIISEVLTKLCSSWFNFKLPFECEAQLTNGVCKN